MKTKIPMTPYEVETIKFLQKQPGQARGIFVPWEIIASYYSFDYQNELKLLGVDENYFVNEAFNKTQGYVANLEDSFDEEEKLEIENKYLEILREHWSLAKIISSYFDIRTLTDQLNIWSKSGPKQSKLFGISPKTGLGVTYFTNSAGITFTIYDSFIIPYTELFYEEHNILPEWNLEDLSSEDIIDTYFLLETIKGTDRLIDLTEWADRI